MLSTVNRIEEWMNLEIRELWIDYDGSKDEIRR